ncbi:hypothetical protein AD44_0006 [Escherichia coli 3-373-03_S4_C3]|nr:hypothetical protein AD44_5356 [Escherichia coli 3-373-03_S4_C3]KEL20936.1 hypothetical protein AD44_4892 [Escherichia coli 3-373-03_S4_C3]KEL21009.1 hypothetical protein AD44_4884 [Escherichia coli 3-373-03_S4_C3]KEL28533.1 hypothetical protein AD44_0006 [Escherichia coli 3-373-03_S4_C3]
MPEPDKGSDILPPENKKGPPATRKKTPRQRHPQMPFV